MFPNIAACRAHAGLPDSADVNEVIGHDKVRAAIAPGLAKLKAQSGSSSGHATRALLLAEPASVDGGEITDKGYINQRAVLTRRASAVATLEDDASAEWIGCARSETSGASQDAAALVRIDQPHQHLKKGGLFGFAQRRKRLRVESSPSRLASSARLSAPTC